MGRILRVPFFLEADANFDLRAFMRTSFNCVFERNDFPLRTFEFARLIA